MAKSYQALVGEILAHENILSERRAKSFIRLINRKINKQLPISFSFVTSIGVYLEYRDRFTDQGDRIGLLIDDSTTNSLKDQLEAAYFNAIKQSEAKSLFMAAMGHEIRTPLNAIIGLLDLSLRKEELKENQNLNMALRSANHLLVLLNDVLDFTKFEAEKVRLTLVKTNLRHLCEEVISAFSGQAQQKNLWLDLYVDPRINHAVMCDDVRLSQVLYNLISNGIKFHTSEKHKVLLKVDLVKEVGARQSIRFSVRDNGIGLTEEQQNRIFTGFMQASPDTHRKFGGSGLGLSICQNICKLMNTELKVNSALGNGACFYFTAEFNFLSREATSSFKHLFENMLNFVTNNELVAESLQRYAGYYGFTVKTAASDKLFKHTEDNTVLLADSTMEDISSESEFIYQLTHCKQKNGLFKTSLKYNGLDSVSKLHLIPLRLSQINLLVGDDIANGQLQYPIEYYDKEQGLSKISALVVEDNPDNIFVLEQQLESIGVNATFCESPEAAVTVFKNGEFNLVISDYQMPELSGAELTEILRKVEIEQERLPCTIVVLTADKTEACQNACQRSGVDNIFIKPLSLSNLHTFLCKFNLYLKSNEHVEVEDNIELVDEFSHRNDLFLDDYNELIDGKETESIDIGPSKDSNYIPMDVTQIYQFTGDLSDKELNEFLLHFKGNLGRRLRTLEFSVKNDDFAKIHSVAHTIKSSSLYVGAQTLSQSCQKLEDAAKKNPIDRNLIQSLWRETEKEMNVVLDFFKEMDLSE